MQKIVSYIQYSSFCLCAEFIYVMLNFFVFLMVQPLNALDISNIFYRTLLT